MSAVSIAAAVPLGLVIGLSLGALGGGGSILAVPALVYGVGEGAHEATTTSLLAVGVAALVGMVGHLRAGSVRVVSGALFGLVGIGGAFVGSQLSRAVPNEVLLLAFSGLIMLAGWRMSARPADAPGHTRSSRQGACGADPRDSPAGGVTRTTTPAPPGAHPDTASTRGAGRQGRTWRVVVTGTGVGFVTGFFGVGGGFVIVPALVLALGYDMPVAVGTSLLVIAISSAEGLLFRLQSSGIDWSVAIPFTGAALIGVILGDVIGGRVRAARLTRWFVWLMVAVACYTAVQSLRAL